MLIIGIDPGLINTGWAVVTKEGSALKSRGFGLIQPDKKAPLCDRLSQLFTHLSSVFSQFHLTDVAIEETFANKNPQTTLKLGMARGVALLMAGKNHLPCTEYSPNQIKKSIVGAGHADKAQMIKMVKIILGLNDSLNEHSADAFAIAITHMHYMESKKRESLL